MKPPYHIVTKSIFIGLLTLFSFLTASAQHHEDPPTIVSRLDPPSIKPGLEIHRDTLIKKIAESDKDFIFKQEKKLNNLPNFIAVDANKSSVQLIGKTDELVMAKWTFVFTPDSKINMTELEKMAWFTYLMGYTNGKNWFLEKIAEVNKDFNKDFSDVRSFDYNRKGEFKYTTHPKTLTLTFKTW